MDCYDASGNIEAQFEPGSDGRVLRNLLGIRDPAEMDDVELDLLDQLYDQIPSMVLQRGRMLASVMAMQAGYREIDFRSWDADKTAYFRAIHAGLDDYAPITNLVKCALLEAASNEGE